MTEFTCKHGKPITVARERRNSADTRVVTFEKGYCDWCEGYAEGWQACWNEGHPTT